jgi:hypothetical protein
LRPEYISAKPATSETLMAAIYPATIYGMEKFPNRLSNYLAFNG